MAQLLNIFEISKHVVEIFGIHHSKDLNRQNVGEIHVKLFGNILIVLKLLCNQHLILCLKMVNPIC